MSKFFPHTLIHQKVFFSLMYHKNLMEDRLEWIWISNSGSVSSAVGVKKGRFLDDSLP